MYFNQIAKTSLLAIGTYLAVLLAAHLMIVEAYGQSDSDEPNISGEYVGADDQQRTIYDISYDPSCNKVITYTGWDLTIRDTSSGGGTGTMVVNSNWQVDFVGQSDDQDGIEQCNQLVTGDSNSDAASERDTYDVTWSFDPQNPHTIYLNLDQTDCSGDDCQGLENITRQVDVLASGDLLYHRPNYPSVRLVMQ